MKGYFNNLRPELKEYFKILSPEIPDFLEEYISVPEMERIGNVSMFCGKDYSKSFGVKFPISNLDHSVGVALIIWNFTHDKIQTIAGLYHDIATPVFKHCIDFMNGDAVNQESTEEKTLSIIENSKEILSLLKRDAVKIGDISNYKVYPIADNDTPKLSADRFEYHFTCGMSLSPVFDLGDIRAIYQNVKVLINEEGKPELGFKSKDTCEKYIKQASMLWPLWANEQNNVFMNFLGDICKAMNSKGFLTVEDLYTLTEAEVIEKIRNCADKNIKDCFELFENAKTPLVSPIPLDGKYCVKMQAKRRYINPLVETYDGPKRIYDISVPAKICIDSYLNEKFDDYGCFDFDFKP